MDFTHHQVRAYFKAAGLKVKTRTIGFQDLARASGVKVTAEAPGRGPVSMADPLLVAKYAETGKTWIDGNLHAFENPDGCRRDAMASLLLAWLRGHTIKGMKPF